MNRELWATGTRKVKTIKSQPEWPDTNLVDDIEESCDILLKLAAGIILFCPLALAITVTPSPLLFTGAARVRASARWQSVAGQVGSDPC